MMRRRVDNRVRLDTTEWVLIVSWTVIVVAFAILLILSCAPVPAHAGFAGTYSNYPRAYPSAIMIVNDSSYVLDMGGFMVTCCTDLEAAHDSAQWETMPCKDTRVLFDPQLHFSGRWSVGDSWETANLQLNLLGFPASADVTFWRADTTDTYGVAGYVWIIVQGTCNGGRQYVFHLDRQP